MVNSGTVCLLLHFDIIQVFDGAAWWGSWLTKKIKNMGQHFVIQGFPKARQIGIGNFQHQLTSGGSAEMLWVVFIHFLLGSFFG